MRAGKLFCRLSATLFAIAGLMMLYAYPVRSQSLQDQLTLLLSPARISAEEGSTFEVSVLLDTKGKSINTVELSLKFPPELLSVVQPSGERSSITVWNAPPAYSNTKGTLNFIGSIPNGFTAQAGLISTITFQAKASGRATVEILPSSRVLANDGAGTALPIELGKGIFLITPRPPEGAEVFSETHPLQSRWYNNNDPILSWRSLPGETGFAIVLDRQPFTVPSAESATADTAVEYKDLADGIWYFHIRAQKGGVWGATTHFALHIDTTPPVLQEPAVDFSNSMGGNYAFISFSAKDSLAGISHYEVGALGPEDPLDFPLLTRTESPYRLSNLSPGKYQVAVRAVDRAGNVQDAQTSFIVSPTPPPTLITFLKKYLIFAYAGLLAILLLLLLTQHFFGYGAFALLRRVFAVIKRERASEMRHQKLSHSKKSDQ